MLHFLNASLCLLQIIVKVDIIVRSTPASRPNTVGLKCPSALAYFRTSVHPQKLYLISTKFGMYVQVDECRMKVCRMTRSKVNIKVTSP